MGANYQRTLTCEAGVNALKPGGCLSFLLRDLPICDGDPYALDVQLRRGNQIMYYHGTTRLLAVQLKELPSEIMLSPSADPQYGVYAASAASYRRLMRDWTAREAEELCAAFHEYLLKAAEASSPGYYGKSNSTKCDHEGYWQNRLCIRFGRHSVPDDAWIVIDRECVVGFGDGAEAEKKDFYASVFRAFQDARDELQGDDAKRWGVPNTEKIRANKRQKNFGDELDMLAIGQQGDLLAIELKQGRNAVGVYWGPLQAAAYGTAFRMKLPEIWGDVVALVEQKVDLGLLPHHALDRLSREPVDRVLSVLAVANVREKSGCWAKLSVVSSRLGEPVRVVEVSEDTNGEMELIPCTRHIWREGRVDLRRDFILLTAAPEPEGTLTQAAALVACGQESDPRFVVEILAGLSAEQREAVAAEIRFYLLDKGEPDPWAYAIHHCSTAANVYSSIHWGYFPAGHKAGPPLEMPEALRRRFVRAGRIGLVSNNEDGFSA